ncbi:hypothetical protein F5984_09775 [Rudanella paleaurantiibacter]|uniref:Schlafen AlbA-2 domain-containing protein n=1 Tax=Rudanella paleaurantiibacter TaxID=2614655 RepID=A0A7J5U023_9BACT|nr:ATP-binding protein [Rudanella paleaurantiibacter]KAB7731093.1 hypothetical protein F5984_09775 [Rudanella paleaurantiibacter]
MDNLNDLIEYENENTRLDFKSSQYTKPQYASLLKDVMAMANASISGDRHIIIGVKLNSDGTRTITGIAEPLVDSATYQQLIQSNIEPELDIDYTPVHFRGLTLGVIRIYNCTNQPYMMLKNFDSTESKARLNVGDSWIRKGSTQRRMMRQDFEKIFDSRTSVGPIHIKFDSDDKSEKIAVQTAGEYTLPSQKAKESILDILRKREELARRLEDEKGTDNFTLLNALQNFPRISVSRSYEDRDTVELYENLRDVEDTYEEDDLFTIYEKHAVKINVVIHNEGDSYIDDASIQLFIPKINGLLVADKVYDDPEKAVTGPFGMRVPEIKVNIMSYPEVSELNDYILVNEHIGVLRHGIPVRAFETPLRIHFPNSLAGEIINIECKLFAKQLRTPIVTNLYVSLLK